MSETVSIICQGHTLKRICKLNPKLYEDLKKNLEGFTEKYGTSYVIRKESNRHKNYQKMTISIYVADTKGKNISKIGKFELSCSWNIN